MCRRDWSDEMPVRCRGCCAGLAGAGATPAVALAGAYEAG